MAEPEKLKNPLDEIKTTISIDTDLVIKQVERLNKALVIANTLSRRLKTSLSQLKIKVE